MTGTFESGKTLCMFNDNAQCSPIWVSQPDGLHLAHFQTFQQELTPEEHAPFDARYQRCVRHCLPGGDLKPRRSAAEP